jgi:hypothetical protein
VSFLWRSDVVKDFLVVSVVLFDIIYAKESISLNKSIKIGRKNHEIIQHARICTGSVSFGDR